MSQSLSKDLKSAVEQSVDAVTPDDETDAIEKEQVTPRPMTTNAAIDRVLD